MSGFAVFNAILLLTMATALFLALVSEALQNRFIASEPLLALGIGVLVGPFVLDWIRLEDLTTDIHPVLEQVARLTLSIAILTATLRVGWKWTRENFRDVLLILGIGMPLMWGLSWAVFSVTLNLALLPCLLMAAIVSPTDPVLAQSIVTSSVAQKWVPGRLRHFISIESAANDGLALLVVMIPILAMTEADHFGAGLLRVALWEIGGALVLGAFLGWLVGWSMKRFGERWITAASEITVSVTLAFGTLAGTKLLGMDGIFAVFGAGLGLAAQLGKEGRQRHEGFNDTMARLFHLPALTLLGLALPIDKWLELGWPLLGAVVLILLFRRLPMLLALKPFLKNVRCWPSAFFVGWFGPIGIAALFYSLLAFDRLGDGTYFAIASAIIAGSVAAHGLTDTVGAKLLGRFLGKGNAETSQDERRSA